MWKVENKTGVIVQYSQLNEPRESLESSVNRIFFLEVIWLVFLIIHCKNTLLFFLFFFFLSSSVNIILDLVHCFQLPLLCCFCWIFTLSYCIPVSPFLPNGIKTVLKAQNQVSFPIFCIRFWGFSFPFLCTNLYITPHPQIFFFHSFFAISEKAYLEKSWD